MPLLTINLNKNSVTLRETIQIFMNLYRIVLICGNKMPIRCNRRFLLQILLLAQHVLGTTMPIIRTSAPHHTDILKTKAPNTTGSSHLYNTLELLTMGIVVPETC
jgi:hypothetical protein